MDQIRTLADFPRERLLSRISAVEIPVTGSMLLVKLFYRIVSYRN